MEERGGEVNEHACGAGGAGGNDAGKAAVSKEIRTPSFAVSAHAAPVTLREPACFDFGGGASLGSDGGAGHAKFKI